MAAKSQKKCSWSVVCGGMIFKETCGTKETNILIDLCRFLSFSSVWSNWDTNWEQSTLYHAADSQHTQNIKICLGWCGPVDWVLAWKPKGLCSVRPHAWMVGQVPGGGGLLGTTTDFYFSPSLSPSHPLFLPPFPYLKN